MEKFHSILKEENKAANETDPDLLKLSGVRGSCFLVENGSP